MGLTPALEEGGKVMVDNLEFKDCQEGIAAFVEKRKPNWCHTQEKFVPEQDNIWFNFTDGLDEYSKLIFQNRNKI